MDQCSELFIIISSKDRLKGLCPMSPPTPLSVRSTSTSNLGWSSDDKRRLDRQEGRQLFRYRFKSFHLSGLVKTFSIFLLYEAVYHNHEKRE